MTAPGDGNTTKMAWIIGCIIVVAAMIFLFTGSYDVKFEDSSFTIDASYWDDMTVNYSDIENIEYRNELVQGSRTFGYGSMSLIMGECENDEFGNYTNYTYSSCDACIVLTIDGKKLVINGNDNESTKEMYDQLITRTNLQTEPSVVQTYDVTDSEHAFENDQLVTMVKYYEMSDGTWKTDNYTYQYRLEITGRMSGAAKDSTYVFLSNKKDITFEQAWKASGLSSSMDDYFQEEDAKLVGMKQIIFKLSSQK